MKISIKNAYQKACQGFTRFFTNEVSLYPLAALRILTCFILLLQAYAISGFLYEFYGEKAIIQNSLNEFFTFTFPAPRIHVIATYFTTLGFEFNEVVRLIFLSYIFSVSCMLIGWKTRFFSILTWLLQYIVMNSAVLSNYGIDAYMHFILFYLAWMPSNKVLSVDAYYAKNKLAWTPFDSISLRIFQLHLCFTYFVAGFGKSLGYMWWNGESVWQAMMLPEYRQFDLSFMADFPIIPISIAYFTLFIETFYPLFIWFKKIRPFWVVAIIGLHSGIAIFQGLHLFAAIMMTLTFCLFGLDHDYSQYSWYNKIKKGLPNNPSIETAKTV